MKILEFKKEEYSQYLLEEGSILFPLLEASEIELLVDIFQQYHPENPSGFYASTHLENKALRKEISNKIDEVISPKLEELFHNIQVLGGAFISKAPGVNGILPLHQDWNIVDEGKARSYNLWIPLCDVNEQNGAMRILARSHRKEKTFRGPNIPPILHPIAKEVDRHMYTLKMKAGEALIYDHALWHSSPENQSNSLRLAIVMGVIPQEAEMKYYHQNGENMEEFNSHAQFFFENDRENGHRSLKLNRSFPFQAIPIQVNDFKRIYLGEIPLVSMPAEKEKVSLFSKFLNLFKSK